MRQAIVLLSLMLFLAIPFAAYAAEQSPNISPEVQAEIDSIQQKIAREGLHWQAGYNKIMDMPLEERHALLTYKAPEEVERHYQKLNQLPPPLLTSTQSVFDWRLLGGVTPVKDQRQCGSCWAFAATGAFESAYLIAEGTVPDFSEQAVVSCDNASNGCNGGWTGSAYNLFATRGAVDESCMPYMADDNIPCTMDQCDVIAYLNNYSEIPNNVNAIKNMLTIGPVSTSFTVYDDFDAYQSGCYEHAGGDPTNHAVVIVGWDDNECNGQGAWIVKNSWGPGWGRLGGYFYIKYGSAAIGSDATLPIYNLSGMGELAYSPDSIIVEVMPGEQTSRVVSLSNIGDAELHYYIDGYSVSEQDSFGYYWRDSDDSDGPDYNWVDISSIGQVVDFYGYNNDGNSGQLDLGFDFNFYGNTYDQLNICTNGWLSFNNAFIVQWENAGIPNWDLPNNMAAVFYDNLIPVFQCSIIP